MMLCEPFHLSQGDSRPVAEHGGVHRCSGRGAESKTPGQMKFVNPTEQTQICVTFACYIFVCHQNDCCLFECAFTLPPSNVV
ncbi:hypothetical protein COCNU_contig69415069G000010 [Cocos nucifera]|nr:hypothetical protein [Cocos nucifera]